MPADAASIATAIASALSAAAAVVSAVSAWVNTQMARAASVDARQSREAAESAAQAVAMQAVDDGAIMAVLVRHAGIAIFEQQIAEESGVPLARTRAALARLAAAGKIERGGRGGTWSVPRAREGR